MPPRSSSAVSLGPNEEDVPPPQQQEPQEVVSVRVGFIGCGTIACAIATGLLTATTTATTSTSSSSHRITVEHVSVSKRSESKSKALQQKFGCERVTIQDQNQEIVNDSDIVFVCLLPQQTSEVLQALQFDETRHVLVSLVSTSKVAQLSKDSGLQLSQQQQTVAENNDTVDVPNVYKMICLPAVATHDGVCIVTPPPPPSPSVLPLSSTCDFAPHKLLIAPLLDQLGGHVSARDEAEMSVLMVPSGLMGTFYGVLKHQRDWLLQQKDCHLNESQATFLMARYYHSMMMDFLRTVEKQQGDGGSSAVLEDLIAEQTPGGINEQGWANFQALGGGLNDYDTIQNCLLDRITGQTDGSLQTTTTTTSNKDNKQN